MKSLSDIQRKWRRKIDATKWGKFVNNWQKLAIIGDWMIQFQLIMPFSQWSIFLPKILIYAPVRKYGKSLFLPCFRGIFGLRILAASENYYKTRKYSAQRKFFGNLVIKLLEISEKWQKNLRLSIFFRDF